MKVELLNNIKFMTNKELLNKYYKQIILAIDPEDPSQFDSKMIKDIIINIYQEGLNN